MTDKATLLELAARCEAATGRNIHIEAEIAEMLGWTNLGTKDKRGALGMRPRHMNPLGKQLREWVRPYTLSLDAAMTLVPEGWRWMTGQREFPHARAYVENGQPSFVGVGARRNPDRQWFEVTAATPALALCAAALKARASQ